LRALQTFCQESSETSKFEFKNEDDKFSETVFKNKPELELRRDQEEICPANFKSNFQISVRDPLEFLLNSSMSWCDPKVRVTSSDVAPTTWLKPWFCFTLAMFWLALFSFILCEAAGQISDAFPGISQEMMGITVCAAGTSFPNLWASLVTANQGKSSMAIANALGSNIQNVFLALALPWFFKAWAGPIPMATPGLADSLAWMAGSWVLLLIFALSSRMRLRAWHGMVFGFLYVGPFLYDACVMGQTAI